MRVDAGSIERVPEPWQDHAITTPQPAPTTSASDATSGRDDGIATVAPEHRLHDIVAHLGLVIWEADPRASQITYVTESIEAMVGYPSATWLTRPYFWREVLHPDDRERTIQAYHALLQAGSDHTIEYRMVRADGRVIWVRDAGYPTLDATGQPIHIRGLLTDMTARRQADQATQHLSAIVSSSGDAIISIGLDGMITSWNTGAEHLYGHAAHEMIGGSIDRIVPPDREHEKHLLLHQVLGGATISQFETVRQRRDGSTVEVALTISPMVSHDVIVGFSMIARDITATNAAQRWVAEAAAGYRALIEQIPAVVYRFTHNPDGVEGLHEYVSPQIEALVGYTPEEWCTQDRWMTCIHPDDRDRVATEDARTNATGEPFNIDYRMVARDGRTVWIHEEAILLRGADGSPLYWQGFYRDVTEEQAAQQRERFLASIVDATDDAVIATDLNDVITSWNAGAERLLGYRAAEIIGRSMDTLRLGARDKIAGARIARVLCGESVRNVEVIRRHQDGSLIDVSMTLSPIHDASGRVIGVSGITRDISDRKRLEVQLNHQAFHDALTGLPNRLLLADRLGQAYASAARHDHRVGVLFLDLDNFKIINDTLGHDAGDQLLVAVSQALLACARADATVARFGGDEFVVVLPQVMDIADAVRVADRIQGALAGTFRVSDRDITVSTSIGIVVAGEVMINSEELLRHADTAMYRAKEAGKRGYAVFDPSMELAILDRIDLERELRDAIASDALTVAYQPQYALESGNIVGVEALVRWQHPQRGWISPTEFVSIAEASGLILALGEAVMRIACRDAVRWSVAGVSMRVSVNLAGRQFDSTGLVGVVQRILETTRLAPHLLALELTESVVMEQSSVAVERLHALRGLGVTISIDDFGTGYSSLAYLRRLPVDTLKINRSFITDLGSDADASILVKAIISLAHALGIAVVAEGVETDAQRDVLRALGCDEAQGFLFAHPMTSTALQELLIAAASANDPEWRTRGSRVTPVVGCSNPETTSSPE